MSSSITFPNAFVSRPAAFPGATRRFFDHAGTGKDLAPTSARRAGKGRAPESARRVAFFVRPPRVVLVVLCAFAVLAAAVWLFMDQRSFTGPFGPVARINVRLDRLETLGPDYFSQGLDTVFPLSAEALAATGRKAGDIFFASGAGGSVVRGDISHDDSTAARHRFSGYAGPGKKDGLLRFAHGLVTIETVDGPVAVTRLRHSPLPFMTAAPDMFEVSFFSPFRPSADDDIAAPLLYGEELNDQGLPDRWFRPEKASASGLRTCEDNSAKNQALVRALIRGLGVPGAAVAHNAQAGKYRGYVSRYARQYGLATALVLAIMHTESNFNPFAVSRSQAVGLMQIVPDTAGHEAHRYLTGAPGAPSLETLFSPEANIRYGVAYLHLLAQRYFGGVQNSGSRQMCMIAAYNGGPGAVLRLFDPDPDAAVARINAMSPEQVYAALTTEMPNAETRRYVDLVLGRMRNYSAH